MELQRLLAPILAANWTVLDLIGDGSIVTNDIGWAPFLNPSTGKSGMAIPLDHRHALMLRPEKRRTVLRVQGGKWVPIIEYDHLDLGHNLSLNDALDHAAQRFIIGPNENTINPHLHRSDHPPLLPEPQQLGFLTPDEARAHDFTWHRLVSATLKHSITNKSIPFDLDWPAITSDWFPPVLIPDNLVEFPPALERKGRQIIVDFYNPEIYYDLSRVLNTRENKGLSEAVHTCTIKLDRYSDPKPRSLLIALRASLVDDLGMPQNSLPDYDEALRLDPSNLNALLNRSVAYLKLGENDKAIRDCSRIISMNPHYGDAYINRGAGFSGLGDYAKALVEANKAIPLYPDGYAKGNALFFRAMVLSMLKENDKALCDYNAALQYLLTGVKKAACYSNRACIHLEQGREDLALEDLSESISLNPSDYNAAVLRSELLYKLRKFEEAIKGATSALGNSRDDQERAYVFLLMGRCHMQEGDICRAISEFSESIKFDPNYAQAFFERGTAYIREASFPQAMSDFNYTIHIDPSSAPAYSNRGIVHAQQGDHHKAIIDYDTAIRLFGDSVEADTAYRNKSMSLAKIGQIDNAEEAIRAAERIAATKPETIATRAYFEYSKGNFDLAASIYNSIDQSHVLSPFPLFRLNKTDEALQKLEDILSNTHDPIARHIIRSELQQLCSIAPETPGLSAAWHLLDHYVT